MKPTPARRSASLEKYVREARHYPALTGEAERALAVAARGAAAGDARRFDALVEANLGVVLGVAHGFRHLSVPYEDLVGEGNLGLVEAARRFDPGRGARFSTCAAFWVRRAILRGPARRTSIVPVPRSRHRRLRSVVETAVRLSQDLGVVAGREVVARHLGLPAAKLDTILLARTRAVPLDAALHDDGRRTLLETLASRGDDPERSLMRDEARRLVRRALESLTARERAVIGLRFGLDGHEGATLRDLGRTLGVSREAIRLIERKALGKLRRGMARAPRSRERHAAFTAQPTSGL